MRACGGLTEATCGKDRSSDVLGFAMAAAATAGPAIHADGVGVEVHWLSNALAPPAGACRHSEPQECFYDSMIVPAEPGRPEED